MKPTVSIWKMWSPSSLLQLLVLPVLLLCLSTTGVLAATATASPSNCVTSGSGNDWSNSDRAVSDDNSYATTGVNDGETSRYLQCTSYGFSLPAHAVIQGISVDARIFSSNNNIADNSVLIVKGGTRSGTDKATATVYPTAEATRTYGGAADLWGLVWSAADINVNNFGIALSVRKTDNSGGNRTASVDHLPITVSYTVPRNCVSATNGNWSSANTWNCGSGPGDGPPTIYDSVTINSHTVTINTNPTIVSFTNNSGTLSQSGVYTLTVTSDFTNHATVNTGNLTVNVGGNVTINGPFTVADLNASGDITANNTAVTVTNLVMQKAGTQAVTLYGSNNNIINLTINNGATVSSTNYSNINLKGTLTNNGVLTLPNTSWMVNGSAAQTIGGGGDSTLGNLTINNATGLTLSRNVTVPGDLTLTSGVIITGSNLLISTKNCPGALSGGGASSFVNGNLRLTFPNWSVTCTYPVGTGTAYAPISVTVNSAGTLTGATAAGEHPQIASSGLNANRNANRYWTLGATGDTLTSPGSYNATFTFAGSDLDAGVSDGSAFKVRRYSTGAWQGTPGGTGSALSTTITGQTAFGSFAVGELGNAGGGCVESSVGNDTLITCTGNGTFTPPANVTSIRYLVVGGGGGGGGLNNGGNAGGGGGGGAGGVRQGNSLVVAPGTTYAITVGAGGVAGVGGSSQGGTGDNSSIGALVTANGGGGGASRGISDNGVNGASGGGGRINGNGGSGSTGQGFAGGSGDADGGSGGGGGASAVGANGSGTAGGSGGAGASNDITGVAVTYGRGGNGGAYTTATRANGASASANTGNGGSGAVGNNGGTAVVGGAGGSGVVIIRYSSLNCFIDSFTGTDGSSPDSNWTRTTSNGTFGLPRIMNNRLRLTDASPQVATAAHLQKAFPGAGNKIIVEFDYFAYNGTGADGIALTFSDASITPKAGAYGGSLGYAQYTGIDGFAGGWLGIGIDEYGNFSNPTEGRSGGPGARQDSVSIRGSGTGTTGYRYHIGTATLSSPGIDQAGATPGPGHRYRVTIDHTDNVKSWVTVERNTGSGFSVIVPAYDAKGQTGQAAVPTNWMLSYTGSTGDLTNIHEIDNLSVCTVNPILGISGPHHIRILHDGEGLTCTPETVTVKACADAACSSLYQGAVSVTLTSGGSVSFNNGQATATVRRTTTGSVALGVSAVTPGAANAARCFNGSTETCTMNFVDAGFVFDIPHHAAESEQTVTINAVKKSDTSTACVPAFASVSKALNFKCAYSDPASGGVPVRIGGAALNSANSAAAACDGSGQSVSLAFGATGEASMKVRYADVGRMSVTAAYEGAGDEAGLVMTGSDDFIAAPAGFTVVPTGPYVAGQDFSATVTGKNSSDATTPNFGKETVAESVTFSLGARVQPGGTNDCVNGPCNGDVAGSVALPWDSGAATASNLTYSEVGTMTLKATLTSGSYLGSSLSATGTSATTGPFVPAYFDTAVTQGCDTFTYSGQPFTVAVTAKRTGGGTTVNYSGNLKNADESDSCTVCAKDVTLKDPTETAKFNSTNTVAKTAFAKGVGTSSTVAYTLTPVTTGPTTITLRAIDSSVSSSGHTEGTAPLRSGRLRLSNAFGAAVLDLDIPAEMQYYNGTHWSINALDNCGTPSAWGVSPSASTALIGSSASGSTQAILGVGAVNGGVLSLKAKAPGNGNYGYADFSFTTLPDYLQFPWAGGTALTSPTARATFGIYSRGSPRIIYRREVR